MVVDYIHQRLERMNDGLVGLREFLAIMSYHTFSALGRRAHGRSCSLVYR